MAKAKQQKVVNFKGTTGPVEALWAKLLDADEFQGKKTYQVTAVFDAEAAMDFLEKIEPAREAAEAACTKADKQRNPAQQEEDPFRFIKVLKEEYDADNQKTGRYLLKLKSYNVDYPIRMYDSAGTRIPDASRPSIGNGSKIDIEFYATENYIASSGKGHLNFYVNAVQIIELVQGVSGGDDGSSFGSYDNGYKADTFGA